MKYICLFLTFIAINASAHPFNTEENRNPIQPKEVTYHLEKCNFSIGNLYGGYFAINNSAGGYTGLLLKNSPIFVVYCRTGASQDDIDGQLGAKKVHGQWISLDYEAPFVPEQNFEAMPLTGKNWTGTAVGYDMITGPEETRIRFFNFCLVENHGPQVLCGQVQGLSAGTINTEEKIKKILAVLKTIEFVDLPPGQPAASRSTTR